MSKSYATNESLLVHVNISVTLEFLKNFFLKPLIKILYSFGPMFFFVRRSLVFLQLRNYPSIHKLKYLRPFGYHFCKIILNNILNWAQLCREKLDPASQYIMITRFCYIIRMHKSNHRLSNLSSDTPLTNI